ncbi:MAG: hypothetical protein IT301_15900 [Dehalococcoidia bacterium]|nr:hypothetical protein [Dehalococcoidia bacterium]
MSGSASALGDATFLSALLDTLIPSSGKRGMPGAGGLGIERDVAASIAADSAAGLPVGGWLEALYAGTPGFATLPAAERTGAVEAHAATNPAAMQALLRRVYLAYYQHPTVLVAIGEPPRPPFPEGFELEPSDPELLAALKPRQK